MNSFRDEKNTVITQQIMQKVNKNSKVKFNQDKINFYQNYNATRGKSLLIDRE